MHCRRPGRSPATSPQPGFGPVRLEQNDVAVLLRSDSLANITSATNALFGSGSNQAGSLFTVTSIRQGFAGGGFYGQQGLPEQTGTRSWNPRRGVNSSTVAALPRLHQHPGVEYGTRRHRQFGDAARPHRSVAQWLLQTGDDHAPLAPVRRSGDLVQEELPQRMSSKSRRCSIPASLRPAGTYALQPPGQSAPRWRKESSATTPTATVEACRWWTAPPRKTTSNYGEVLPRRHHHSSAGRFQHARQSIPLHIGSDGRPLQQQASGRVALPDVPANHRDLQ